MKKIKGIIFAAGFVLCGFIVGACGSTVKARQDEPLKIWKENDNGHTHTYQLVDEKTGVNYIVVTVGNAENGIAITPRLNHNGSLYTSK